jgi:hypothetical protein
VPSKIKHAAMFPPEIPRRCILIGSRPGDVVLDPFMGSGTTAVVARKLARRWVGYELNPEYVEIIRKRVATDEDDPPPAIRFPDGSRRHRSSTTGRRWREGDRNRVDRDDVESCNGL